MNLHRRNFIIRWVARAASCTLPFLPASPAVPAAAPEAYVKILSPADGAKLDSMDLAKLVYEVRPGPKGDHIHVYVDGKEVGILQRLKGSYALESLSPGQHSLCIKVVNKAHVPIGVEQCVKARVE